MSTFVEPSLDNGGRRTGIRAGAVSGPWRGAASGRGTKPKVLAPSPSEPELDENGDLPAPVFRLAEIEAVEAPIFSEQTDMNVSGPNTKPQVREVAYVPRRSPILGAVLGGTAIALTIVALAFFFRPQVTSHAETPMAATQP